MQRQKVTEQKRATRTPDLTCHEEGTGLPGLVWFRPSVWWHCCVVWAKAPSHSASHESWRCISYEATTSDTHTQLDLFLRPLRLDYVPSDLHLKFPLHLIPKGFAVADGNRHLLLLSVSSPRIDHSGLTGQMARVVTTSSVEHSRQLKVLYS
jgi:hypothetical protein